jgi:hypothetical protein
VPRAWPHSCKTAEDRATRSEAVGAARDHGRWPVALAARPKARAPDGRRNALELAGIGARRVASPRCLLDDHRRAVTGSKATRHNQGTLFRRGRRHSRIAQTCPRSGARRDRLIADQS